MLGMLKKIMIVLCSERLQREVGKSIEDYNSLQDIKYQRTLKDHRQEIKR